MTEDDLKLREQALRILMKNFGDCNKNRNKSIYECADDWCKKFKTTSGLVNYYKTYYNYSK